MIVTNDNVWLEWAFCEADSSRFDDWCPGEAIDDLRKRIQKDELKLDALSPEDKATLRSWVEQTRARYIGYYLNCIDSFILEEWSASKLKEIMCMCQMGGTSFKEYMDTSPPPDADIKDARIAAKDKSWNPGIANPVIIGQCGGKQFLVEGYTRSILFVRDSPEHSLIKVYVPCLKS